MIMQRVKEESQTKLSKVSSEVEKAKSSCKAELIRLQMALKKAEIHAEGLELQLKQKVSII